MARDSAQQYDAFISYSHAIDSRLAPKLQDALHSFARKWYARRALRTFRDKTGLSATPELWRDIERALDQSRYLLLLASPEGAASHWIQREVSWWLEHRSTSTMLIVLTSGDLQWDSTAGDFDWTLSSAVPAVLRGRFPEEPLYVDLRWARDEQQLSLRHSQFRSAVIDIAAPLHGRPRDELDGEDLRQHRRFKAVAWTAAGALLALTVISGIAAYQAVRSARLAETRRVEAEQQRDLALARQLSAQSDRIVLEQNLDFERAALLAAASLRRAHIFDNDLAARERLELLPASVRVLQHGSPVRALAFSTDGKHILTGTADGRARIWERESGRELKRFEHRAPLQAVGLGADGRYVLTAASDGTIREWDAETGHHSVPVSVGVSGLDRYLVAFSADGARAVTARVAEDFGADIRLWDLRSKAPAGQIAFGRLATSVALDMHGARLVAGTWTGSVHIWTVGEKDEAVQGLSGRFEAVAFSAAGNDVVAVSDRTVWVFDSRRPDSRGTNFRHPTGAGSVALRDGRVLTGGPGPPTLWDASTGTELVRVSHAGPVHAVAISPDGRFVATGSEDGTVRVSRAETGKYVKRLPCANRRARLPLATDGRRVGTRLALVGDCSADGQSVTPASALPVLQQATGGVLSFDERVLITVEQSEDHFLEKLSRAPQGRNTPRLVISDPSTGATIAELPTGSRLSGIAVSRDGRRVATVGQSVNVVEIPNGASTLLLNEPRRGSLSEAPNLSVAFSPDGSRLIVGMDGEARVFSIAGGAQLAAVKQKGRVRTVHYSPDGRRILTAGDDGTARIWDAHTGHEQFSVRPGSTVLDATWSDDGRWIATANFEGVAQVWAAEDGRELMRIAHRGPVRGVAFTPDARVLVTANGDFVDHHSLEPATLADQLCQRILLTLTTEQWRQYFGSVSFQPPCQAVPSR